MSKSNEKCNIAVIGGGASGMTAAIFASKNKDASITIFERNDMLGKKILSTGNGHANITNAELKHLNSNNVNHYYRADDIDRVYGVFDKFGYNQIIEFFDALNIKTMNKNGYLYPYSNQAVSVLNAFINEINKAENIDVVLNTKINNIKKEESGYTLFYKKGISQKFDKVILCGGGCAFPKSGSDGTSFYLLDCLGIKYNKVLPALCECKNTELLKAAGIRCQVSLYAHDDEEKLTDSYDGELQINKSGLSGIVVFQVSSIVARKLAIKRKVYICIDFLKDFSEDEVFDFIKSKSLKYSNMRISELFDSMLPKNLVEALSDKYGFGDFIPNDSNLDKLKDLIKKIKNCSLVINSVADFEKAQTSAGGISFDLIDDNMQINGFENLYVCGEIIDADGICGGYNLSFAFATGAIAGMGAL